MLDFNRLKDGKWEVKIRNRATGQVQTQVTDYVFIGAGGAAIPLYKNRYS